MKRLICLIFFICALCSHKSAADIYSNAVLTVTNYTHATNGASLYLQGQSVVWTNASLSALLLKPRLVAITNSNAKATTNLYTKLRSTYGSALFINYASATSLNIRTPPGVNLALTNSVGWASVAFSTNSVNSSTMTGSFAASNLVAYVFIDANTGLPLATGDTVDWGDVGGTLSDQSDLQAALDAKLNLSGGTMSGTIDLGINGQSSYALRLYNDGIQNYGIYNNEGTLTISRNLGEVGDSVKMTLDSDGLLTATTFSGSGAQLSSLSGSSISSGTVAAARIDSAMATDAEVAAGYQPLDSDLTSWAAITRASGFDTFTATPSSANLDSLVTDDTGSGSLVFATSPTLVTPEIGAATGTSLSLSANGSQSAPAFARGNSGFYFSGSGGSIFVTIGNSYKGSYQASEQTIANANALGWESAGAGTSTDVRLSRKASGVLSVDTGTTGNELGTLSAGVVRVKSGSNSKAGTFTLSSGAATVSNTSVTANSVVVMSLKTASGSITAAPYLTAITASTSFVVAAGAGDNSTYNYIILEVN